MTGSSFQGECVHHRNLAFYSLLNTLLSDFVTVLRFRSSLRAPNSSCDKAILSIDARNHVTENAAAAAVAAISTDLHVEGCAKIGHVFNRRLFSLLTRIERF